MSKFGDSFRNASNTERDEHLNMICSMKVLVVDHKMDFLAYVAEVLHSCSFEVTCVDNSGAALRLLSKKKSGFDLLMIDSGMSDMDVHTFLRLTKNMDLLSIVMSEQEDDTFLLEAFKSGAFLVIKRPLTMDAVRHMRQDIIRERVHKHGNFKNKNIILKAEPQAISIHENISFGSKKNNRGETMKQVNQQPNSHTNLFYQSSEEEDDDDESTKKKICLEWTHELHQKFLNAVSELGEGRCYPKEILKLMGVPGLTRMQVASHLQKCRKEKWKSSETRRTPISSNNYTSSSTLSPLGISERKFGCMPLIKTDKKDQADRGTVIGINLSINRWQTTEGNHKNDQTYKGVPMMNGFIQTNIAHRTQDTLFPLGNGVESNHQKGFGRSITKTTNNYFLPAFPGSHDVGLGSSDSYAFPSIRRQTSDDFPDFLKDIDGNGPNESLIP